MVSLGNAGSVAPHQVTDAALFLLIAHLVATAVMTGILWFVQVVHYPLFDKVGASHFVEYELDNTRRTSFVVGPPMAVEGVTALLLFFAPPAGLGRGLPFIAGVLLAIVLLSTIAVQVPMHASLSERHDTAVVARLVRSNWLRTIGWSIRTALAVAMLVQVTGG